MAWHKNFLTSLIFAVTFLFETGLAVECRWFVSASSAVAAFAWAACAYVLPAHAGLPCVAADLLVGLNAIIQAHGGNGQRGAMIGTRHLEEHGLHHMYHHTPDQTFDFINTTALTPDWHNVTLPDHELDLIVRRLPDGRTHARTQGFQYMTCMNGGCPAEALVSRNSRLFRRAPVKIEDIDFSWAEPSNYASGTQTGVKAAASGAAGYVVDQKKGTFNFCSRAISSDGQTAERGVQLLWCWVLDRLSSSVPVEQMYCGRTPSE